MSQDQGKTIEQMTDDELGTIMDGWMNRVCKWRMVFAGWQLGTRDKEDGECLAVRDHRELSIIQRVEMNALTSLLVDKGVITKREWMEYLLKASIDFDQMLEKKFPGFKSSVTGITVDTKIAQETMQKLHFPG